jgi:hypothetical protein
MAAGTYDDLIIEAGADCPLNVVYKENGSPVDVTGWTITCKVNDARTGDFLFSGSVYTPSDNLGLISITFPASVTVDFQDTPAVYDILAVKGSGQKIHILRTSTAQIIAAQTK